MFIYIYLYILHLGIFSRCIPAAPSPGQCTFGGGRVNQAGNYLEVATVVLAACVLCGVVALFCFVIQRRLKSLRDREQVRIVC